MYNKVVKSNLIKWLEQNKKQYDVAIFGDVLEHLPKDQIDYALYLSLKHFKNILISVPLGKMEQGDVGGNIYEMHRSTISKNDFDKFNVIEKNVKSSKNHSMMNVWISNEE